MIDIDNETLETIKNVLVKFPQVSEAFVFGSRALGTAKIGSDIDIALKGKLDLTLTQKIRYLLNEEGPLAYFFDVIDYETIDNKTLKDHIDTYGEAFYP